MKKPQITVLLGRCGRGKTDALVSLAAECVRGGNRALLLLPEQYTFDGEVALAKELGGALIRSEALGMSRLADRVLSGVKGGTHTFLTPEGRRMALRRTVGDNRDKLVFYGRVSAHGGFLEKVADLIDSFKAAGLSPDDVGRAAHAVDDPVLFGKLSDISLIYAGLDQYMSGRFTDRADKLSAMADAAIDSPYLRDLNVYMDFPHAYLYDELTYRAVRAISENCSSFTMTMRMCDRDDGDAELFSAEVRALKKLSEFAALRLLKKDVPKARPKGFLAIERFLFAPAPKERQEPDGVLLSPVVRPSEETAAAAERIGALIADGAAPSDIYVAVCGDSEGALRLRAALSKRGIRLFMDERRPLTGHRIIEFIMASISAATKNLRREDVLRAAKSGLSPIDTEQAELLEDYCLRFGVSYSAFFRPFFKGEATRPRLLARAEEARGLLVPGIAALSDRLKQCADARSFAKAVYDYATGANLWERLQRAGDELIAQGRGEEAAENAQVWNAFLELLDQIAELMDGPMTTAEFAAVLDEGFSAHSLGLIPPETNAVGCGTVQTASGREIKHLIVLGANDGALPADTPDDGILNDRDIQKLRAAGIDAFTPTSGRGVHERHISYALLSRPTSSLYMSWSLADDSGRALAPSYAADRLCALFPDAVSPYIRPTAYETRDEEAGFDALIRGLRRLFDSGQAEEGLSAVYAHYANSTKYSGRLAAAEARLYGSSGMSAKAARALYGNWRGSTVTRLEKFNGCPFSYLVAFGLRPDPVKKYEEAPSDEGDFYHEAFCEFIRTMERQKRDWSKLTDDEATALFLPILDGIAASHNDGVFSQSAKNRRALTLLKRAALRTLLASIAQIRRGGFTPAIAEAALGKELPEIRIKLSDGGTATLVGRVDRVDIAAPKGSRSVPYVRIIDYKTGNKSFSYAELAGGLQLQLPLYLQSAGSLGRAVGMFYLHVGDPIADALDGGENELKNYKLKGILLDDLAIARSMDAESQGFSPFLPVRFTKTGMSAQTGTLVSPKQLKAVMDRAQTVAASTIERILSGECAPYPARIKNRTACDWCEYGAICRFEPQRGDKYRDISDIDPRDVIGGDD